MRVLPTSSLTTLERLKLQLSITRTDTTYDDFLTRLIIEYSSAVEDYLDRSLGTGQYTQKQYIPSARDIPNQVFLALYPTASIDSFTYKILGGTPATAPADTYYVIEDEGRVILLPELWDLFYEVFADGGGKPIELSLQHTGGYILPANYGNWQTPAAGELPRSIENTAIDLCKAAYYTRNVNPLVKSEMVPDVLQQTYFSPEQVSGGSGGVLASLTNISSYQDNRIV